MSSFEAYKDKYKQGYGTMYPEGHIIRFYEKFLKYEKAIDGSNKEKVLDFGCGNGTHSVYMASKGFDVYGVDIISSAIEEVHTRLPSLNKHFKCITPNESIENIFENKFDIIIANQSLYYLSNDELQKTLMQFDNMLNPNGIVFFTMMGVQSYYYEKSTKLNENNGLREVTLTGRLNETTFISFIESESDLTNKFSLFTPDFIGHYDCTMREGSGFHYQFIGLKK